MKIKEVTDECILFDNGNRIHFDHEYDCCEYNYADFSILDEHHINYRFEFSDDLKFKFVNGIGFVFGSKDRFGYDRYIFIPCYSEQNGYYTDKIDIYYNDTKVLSGNCQEIIGGA